MKHFLFLLALFAASNFLIAQQVEGLPIYGELIIHFEQKTDINTWLLNNKLVSVSSTTIKPIKKLGIRHNIHHFSLSGTVVNYPDFLSYIQSQEGVISAQFNGKVNFRNTPNDTLFQQQWDMDIIHVQQAWETTTGGQTPSGTKIVVANSESGIEIDHDELFANLWHNTAEILGDSIDNDSNGYIDDDIGWDYYFDTPNLVSGAHGTSSTGIIGALGNNTTGVTGVNWEVDLMLFTFPRFISDLIQSYEYVIDQRMRFNESQGNLGAFVVAVNASFGDEACCEDHPVWASMFDLLGEVGILTSSGVVNSPLDVDFSCDFPASCISEFLVISCNTNSDDNLDQTSAWGEISVDFGSPGGQSFTTKINNTYGTFGGTSAATPHVTGAIALLYSAPFAAIEQLAIEHPKETALMIRDYIINNVEIIPSMDGVTVTGGRLDLGKSMSTLAKEFGNVHGYLQVDLISPNPTDEGIKVDFLTPVNGEYLAEVYNAVGQLLFQQKVVVGLTSPRFFYVPTDYLPQGVYVLNFGKGDDWVANKFVVLRN